MYLVFLSIILLLIITTRRQDTCQILLSRRNFKKHSYNALNERGACFGTHVVIL